MIQAIDMVDRNDRIKLLRIQRKKATSSRSCSQHRKIARQNAYTNSQLRNKNIEYKLKTKTHTPYFDPEQSNKMRRKKNSRLLEVKQRQNKMGSKSFSLLFL